MCCPKPHVTTFNHVIRYICKHPTVEGYDTEYSKYATPCHFLLDNVGCAAPKINDYSLLFNIGGGVDVNYLLFLVFRGKNWNIGSHVCHENEDYNKSNELLLTSFILINH